MAVVRNDAYRGAIIPRPTSDASGNVVVDGWREDLRVVAADQQDGELDVTLRGGDDLCITVTHTIRAGALRVEAGFPALAPGDYDEATKTYDFLGFVTRTPLLEGGDEPRHVLVREIHDLRKLIRRKRDAAGRPVEAVRVTFMEEWMARQERRPLLDAGARVFYGKGHEITD